MTFVDFVKKEDWQKLPPTPASSFLHHLSETKVTHLIQNASVDLKILRVDDTLIPITFDTLKKGNSYSSSMFHQYISYGKEQLSHTSPFVKRCIRLGMNWFGLILKLLGIKKAIQINNWLFCTQFYPKLDRDQIEKVTQFLKQHYPIYALIWRNVPSKQNGDLALNFPLNRYKKLLSRSVWLLQGQNPELMKLRHLKGDLQLLKEGGYFVVRNQDLKEDDFARIASLHRQLQVEKYSSLNAALSENFIKIGVQTGFIQILALKKQERIDAACGLIIQDKMMTAPIFGYDTTLPQEIGLYRQLTALTILEAKEKGLLYHMSGGAGSFKKRRGAISTLEYHVIFDRGLSLRKKAAWSLLCSLMSNIGLPLMQKID